MILKFYCRYYNYDSVSAETTYSDLFPVIVNISNIKYIYPIFIDYGDEEGNKDAVYYSYIVINGEKIPVARIHEILLSHQERLQNELGLEHLSTMDTDARDYAAFIFDEIEKKMNLINTNPEVIV
jgi:hypothetical protein